MYMLVSSMYVIHWDDLKVIVWLMAYCVHILQEPWQLAL